MFFGSVEKPPRLSEFELEVPEKLIAQDPCEKRDECKLMVLNRAEQTIEHRQFKDVVDYFNKGDVLVMNNTRVYPARLYANKDKSGARVEVFLLRELADDLWEAMVKPARKVRIGNKLLFNKEISLLKLKEILKTLKNEKEIFLMVTHYGTISAMTGINVDSGGAVAYDVNTKISIKISLK